MRFSLQVKYFIHRLCCLGRLVLQGLIVSRGLLIKEVLVHVEYVVEAASLNSINNFSKVLQV